MRAKLLLDLQSLQFRRFLRQVSVDEVADAVGIEIGTALHDSALGLAVWAAVHGLAMVMLRNVVDLGQRKSGLEVLPSRAEIVLRSLFSTKRD